METLEHKVIQRYFRKTPAFPDGSVVHHGDCDFFSIHICTCGLHHDLKPAIASFIEERYPNFFEEVEASEVVRERLMYPRKS